MVIHVDAMPCHLLQLALSPSSSCYSLEWSISPIIQMLGFLIVVQVNSILQIILVNLLNRFVRVLSKLMAVSSIWQLAPILQR